MDENSPSELDRIFIQITAPSLGLRLVQQLRDTIKVLFGEPGDFLRNSLLPGRNWFPARLLSTTTEAAKSLAAHPVRFVIGAFAPGEICSERRRRFIPLLTVSVVAHSVLIAVLFVVAMLNPFWVPIVDTKYNEPDWTKILAPLHYPRGMFTAPSSQASTMTIEKIRKRALERKKHEEQARLERERRRIENEEAAKKAEDARKAEEAKKEQDAKATQARPSSSFGEINVAPIRDIVGELYQMYQSGQLDLGDNYTIMASFKILTDGSIPIESIKILKSSHSQIIDEKALQILWRLGESHALGPLSSLSSNTIELAVNESVTRLSITTFAPTAEDAKAQAFLLNLALGQVKRQQREKNPMVAELLSHLVLKADNKRIDADMTVPRARASEMMQARFSKKSGGL